MKKKLLCVFIVIIIIILATTSILFVKQGHGKGFPHFKQAILRYNGSIYALQDQDFTLPLDFVDESEMSEMASAKNIKSIEILNKDNTIIPIKKWETDETGNVFNTIIRKIYLSLDLKYKRTYYPYKVKITFADGKTKEYNLGNLKIKVISKEDISNEYPNDVQANIITARVSGSSLPVTGLSIGINTQTGNLIVKGIDLGINQIGIDEKNIIIKNEPYSNSFAPGYSLDQGRQKNENWVKIFDAPDKVNEKLSSNINTDIKLSRFNGYSVLFLPLVYESSIRTDEIKCFCITLDLEYQGKQYKSYILSPLAVDPIPTITFDSKSLLKEEGK